MFSGEDELLRKSIPFFLWKISSIQRKATKNVQSMNRCIIFPLLPLPAWAKIEEFQSDSMTLCIEFLQLLWTIKRNFYLEETQGTVERGYHLLLLRSSREPSQAGVWKLLSGPNTACTSQGLCTASSIYKNVSSALCAYRQEYYVRNNNSVTKVI